MPEYGEVAGRCAQTRRDDLIGILNGIDTEVYNPADDEYIPHPYSADDLSASSGTKKR